MGKGNFRAPQPAFERKPSIVVITKVWHCRILASSTSFLDKAEACAVGGIDIHIIFGNCAAVLPNLTGRQQISVLTMFL